MSENKSKYIRWFDETSIEDVPLVGGKKCLSWRDVQGTHSKGRKDPEWFFSYC